jgi:hypothetical protein
MTYADHDDARAPLSSAGGKVTATILQAGIG